MKNSRIWITAGAALALAACSEPPPPEEIVAERAQARWDALIDSDVEASYRYESPGYRARNKVTDHAVRLSRRQVTWREAVVRGVECGEDRCTAEVVVSYSADGAPGVLSGMRGERPVEEVWIQIDGQWWHADPD